MSLPRRRWSWSAAFCFAWSSFFQPKECNVAALITLVAVFLCVAGCASPEAARTRGGGPGADVGNRDKIVRMHEGARPFEDTPKIIPAKHPPLDPASQAEELSRK
jgi:hypothetical protein